MPKDEDLAEHPGKKEMSIKDNHQAGCPSPAASLRRTIPPVLNSTALGEQVGLELSGRQQV